MEGDQTACKPGSVPPGPEDPDAAIIPLDRPSRDGSRDLPEPLRPTTALPYFALRASKGEPCEALAEQGHISEARYQVLGTRSARCMSFAMSAAPFAVCAPDNAKALEPVKTN